ncbi:MAG: sigma-54-dependent Fis family transcriptional regulator [Deltaproteobacteria bacterium]|nr:sigma-54-dependent Fis family transcriptional regulator [Deltaproteobacteria bacterium]
MAPRASILVVDDERSIRDMLSIYLKREGFDVSCAPDGQAALECCQAQKYDIVIADIKMPRLDGIALLHRVREFAPETIFIMITAFASLESARDSMRQDAWDYITKPFDVDDIRRRIDEALSRKIALVEAAPGQAAGTPFGMIGSSAAMRKIFDLIPRAASAKSNVLITGESGTGKELVARAIHYHSNRSENAFVVINCGGIPENLLESELFGYKKGAFTGAQQDKKGFLHAADSGTLFLDEVGDLPPALQVKLLRVVQERTFTPVGATDEHKADVRFIAATNKDLAAEVQAGRFREDLFYRLNVINIHLPPLRERREDIPVLVEFFTRKFAREMGKDVGPVSPFIMECLCDCPFPGNVRELENLIEKSVALAKTSIMLPDVFVEQQPDAADADESPEGIPPGGLMLDEILDRIERRHIDAALRQSGGSIKKAAQLLGITFRSMRYRLQKHGIAK